MYWRVVISLFMFSALRCFSQDIGASYDLAGKYMKLGDYSGAEQMYQRVAYFDSNFVYLDAYQKIAEIKLYNKEYSEAKSYFKLYSNWADSDSIRVHNTFNLVLCSFMLEEYKQAVLELLLVKGSVKAFGLYDKWKLHLGVAYFQDEQFEKSKEIFSDLIAEISQEELDKIFRKNNKLERKFNRVKVQLMSIFIPGAGQVYTGNVGAGINSLAVVGGFVYLFTRVIGVLSFTDAVLAVYPWISRYYMGGVKKAGLFADERVKIKRSQYYQRILQLVKENQ